MHIYTIPTTEDVTYNHVFSYNPVTKNNLRLVPSSALIFYSTAIYKIETQYARTMKIN